MDVNKFITLPSNASKKIFPDNTQGDFTVKLSNSIDLSKYDAALADIQYPNTWLTLKDACMQIGKDATVRTARFLDARFSTMDELIEAVNHLLHNYHVQPQVKLHYDKFTMHTTLVIKAANCTLKFDKQLSSILGFTEDKTLIVGINQSDRPSDLDNGMTALYVYSDVVQNQMVGDTLSPLLRIVPLTGERNFSNSKDKEFTKLRYLPTVSSNTDTIHIVIRRDNGETIPFTTGKVIVTLALRLKRQ